MKILELGIVGIVAYLIYGQYKARKEEDSATSRLLAASTAKTNDTNVAGTLYYYPYTVQPFASNKGLAGELVKKVGSGVKDVAEGVWNWISGEKREEQSPSSPSWFDDTKEGAFEGYENPSSQWFDDTGERAFEGYGN